MLRREHDRVDGARHEALVSDRHLGLAVRTQVVDLAALAELRESLGEPVGEPHGHWHELRRLVGGETEHDALVTGALAAELITVGALALFECGVDPLGDIGRLGTDRDCDAAVAAVEAHLGGGVADAGDDIADDARDVHVPIRRDLAGDVDEPRRDEGLDRDPARRVLREQGVEDRVRDLVTDLVRMPLGHRF
jgi:hypothetical protein